MRVESCMKSSRFRMITRCMSKKTKLSIFSSLPEEIILSEILPRLPVKSLLRFKRVSKSWFSLISSPKFAKTQLHYSAKTTPLIVSAGGQGFTITHCLANSMLTRSTMNVDDYVPIIVGCCNGLCCMLINGKQFQLWNPSTGEIRRLPPVADEYKWVPIYGFGYDEFNDDYKVVAVLRTKTSTTTLVSRLYSLKTDSWKTIRDFLGRDGFVGKQIYGGRGVLFNGKLHWMGGDYLKIASYDFGTEAAGVVDLPSSAESFYHQMCVIQGCLSVNYYKLNKGPEAWVMKEYGVKESWCRLMTVPNLCANHNLFHKILCISEDRVVLKVVDSEDVGYKSTLYFYNPKTDSVSHIKLKVYETSQSDFCIQSLISPSRHGELKEPN